MTTSGINEQSAPIPANGSRHVLAGAAVVWGVVLVLLAAFLPVETVLTDSAGVQPRISLLAAHGPQALLIAAVPLLVAVLTLLLLRTGSRAGLTAARILAVVLLLSAIAGFVTYLIGIYVVPCGILLCLAAFLPIRQQAS